MQFGLCELVEFLTGDTRAIYAVAAAPQGWLVGLTLVLSAALARNYRTRWLIREPLPLLLPFAASTVVAVALFVLLYLRIAIHELALPPAAPLFLSFLGIYWCTAPLAWLYALPFEAMTSPDRAIILRLRMLGVVAAWRVALMSRAVFVLTDCGPFDAISLVMAVAAYVAIALVSRTRATRAASTPTLGDAMSGVPGYSPGNRRPGHHLREVVIIVGWMSMPVWLLGVVFATPASRPWIDYVHLGATIMPDLRWFAGGSVLFWLALLPLTQPAQRRRWRVESAYRDGDPAAVIAALSVAGAHDFPASWTPPPVSEFREPPSLLSLVECAMSPTAAPWVRDVYLAKFRSLFADPNWFWEYDDELTRVIAILEQLPNSRALAAQAIVSIEKSDAEIAEFRRQWHSDVAPLAPPDRPDLYDYLLKLTHIRPAARHSDRRPALIRRFYEIAGQAPPGASAS